MPYLDKTGTEELWSKIKSNFAHNMTASTFTANGIDISLNSGMKTKATNEAGEEVEKWAQLSTVTIPTANSTTGGLVTPAQATAINSLATVATSGKYSDLTGTPTIDTSLSTTSTNAVTNKAITTALSGKAATSHTHTKSQITDFPASLKNPEALDIYDNKSGTQITSYTGSSNIGFFLGGNIQHKAIEPPIGMDYAFELNADVIFNSLPEVATSNEIVNAIRDGKTVILMDNSHGATYGATLRLAWYTIPEDLSSFYAVFVGYDPETFQIVTWQLINNTSGLPSSSDSWTDECYTIATMSEIATCAKLAGATFTGAVTLPTISGTTTNDDTAATTAFVQAVVKASGAGVVHYRGAAASTEKLTNYVTGDYWVASAEFSYTGTDSKTVYIEKGDMLFANTTATDFVAANFDVVQANITAMTTAEVDAICTLD